MSSAISAKELNYDENFVSHWIVRLSFYATPLGVEVTFYDYQEESWHIIGLAIFCHLNTKTKDRVSWVVLCSIGSIEHP